MWTRTTWRPWKTAAAFKARSRSSSAVSARRVSSLRTPILLQLNDSVGPARWRLLGGSWGRGAAAREAVTRACQFRCSSLTPRRFLGVEMALSTARPTAASLGHTAAPTAAKSRSAPYRSPNSMRSRPDRTNWDQRRLSPLTRGRKQATQPESAPLRWALVVSAQLSRREAYKAAAVQRPIDVQLETALTVLT